MSEIQDFLQQMAQEWGAELLGDTPHPWLLAVLVIILTLILRGLMTRTLIGGLKRLTARTTTGLDDELLEALRAPLRFALLAMGLLLAVRIIGPPAPVAAQIEPLTRSLLVYAIFWTAYRMATSLSSVLDKVFSRVRGQQLGQSLKEFAIRIFRTVVVILGAASILEEWGFDIAAVLGGLGLVGMAFAFGAQSLIADLFGGLVIFLDRIFVEGDWIRAGEVEGTVEKIGLRTTKIRRFDQGLVTAPNSNLTGAAVINFSKMNNRRIYMMIGLEYRTNREQLDAIVNGIRACVYDNPAMETDPDRVTTLINVDSFNDSSIDIMLYCFTKTVSWGEWMSIKEALLHQIKDLVEGAGAGFAFPSSSVYVETLPFGTPEAVPARPETQDG